MSQDVWDSPLRNRDGFWGDLFRSISAAYYKLLHWLVLVAPLLLITWIGSFFALKDMAALRLTTTASFGWLFALCIGFHLLELVMAVPLRDSKYPVVLADPVMADFLIRPEHGLRLSLTTGLYASLLWISRWNSWQDFAGNTNTLIFAGVNTVLAGAMCLYGRCPPYYFFRKPSQEDTTGCATVRSTIWTKMAGGSSGRPIRMKSLPRRPSSLRRQIPTTPRRCQRETRGCPSRTSSA
jgi:hypothetical protein